VSLSSIPFLDLAAPHLELEQELTQVFQQAIRTAGAGRNADEAAAPAVIETRRGARVLVYAFCAPDSGAPPDWAASRSRAGVNLLQDLSKPRVDDIARLIRAARRPGDLVVASIHWGGNWGYAIDSRRRDFAHGLIDRAQVDLVHGHSSHHAQGIEVHQGKLILYGCGDFLNDYEGIAGQPQYRPGLTLIYLPQLDPGDGRLLGLQLVPMRIRRFGLERASPADANWLLAMLNREGIALGTAFGAEPDGRLRLADPGFSRRPG